MSPAIKICGITKLADAVSAAEAGAMYLGLNFFEQSPRYLEIDAAREIAESIKIIFPQVKLVGIFVNEEPDVIRATAETALLDIIQLHGDENFQFCTDFTQPVWKAFRIKNTNSLTNLDDYLHCDGIVFDAYKKGEYGGTGEKANWAIIQKARAEIPFLILAGGISAENISAAVRELQPDVLDICSSVEAKGNPRHKDPQKIKALFEAISRAE
jgi:phosphoribosylanthranilate isomerase